MPATTPPPAAPAKPAAKPATTTPAPQKPAASAPPKASKPPAAPPPEKDPNDWMGEIAADLDKLSAEDDAKQAGKGRPSPPAKPPAKPKTEPPPADAEPEPQPDPEAQPGLEPEPEPEPAKPEPEPEGLIATRQAYRGLKKRVAEELEPKLQRLESRLKELESGNPEEIKALQERFEASEKRRQQLESRIADVDYRETEEFQNKYAKPYVQAWEEALGDLRELQVEQADGTLRDASKEDLLEIANLPLGEARKRAKALFGESADDMMLHRRKIIDLARAQNQALDEAKKQADTRAKTAEADRKATMEKVGKLWNESLSSLETRYPAMFAKVEGDTEGNALLEKGHAQANKVFAPTEENKPKSLEEKVRLDALAFRKVANHDRLAFWLKKLREENKELKATLEQYEQSEPSGGQGGKPGPSGRVDYMGDANAELDALDKKGP